MLYQVLLHNLSFLWLDFLRRNRRDHEPDFPCWTFKPLLCLVDCCKVPGSCRNDFVSIQKRPTTRKKTKHVEAVPFKGGDNSSAAQARQVQPDMTTLGSQTTANQPSCWIFSLWEGLKFEEPRSWRMDKPIQITLGTGRWWRTKIKYHQFTDNCCKFCLEQFRDDLIKDKNADPFCGLSCVAV